MSKKKEKVIENKVIIEKNIELLEQGLKCAICKCATEAVRIMNSCPLCKVPTFKRGIQKNQTLAGVVDAYRDLKDALLEFSFDNGDQFQIYTTPGKTKSRKLNTPSPDPGDHDEQHNYSSPKSKKQCTRPSAHTVFIPLSPYSPPRTARIRNIPPQQEVMPESPHLSKCRKFVLLTSSLDAKSQDKLQEIATKLKGATVVDDYSTKVTHLVVGCRKNERAKRTIKYCFCVLAGKWVVSYDWVKKCSKEGRWFAEEGFEVIGDTKALDGPKSSRESKFKADLKLFDGYRIHLYGDMVSPTRSDVKKLLEIGNAFVITTLSKSNERHRNEIIICDPAYIELISDEDLEYLKNTGLQIVDYNWVLDSTSHYSILPLTDYQIHKLM